MRRIRAPMACLLLAVGCDTNHFLSGQWVSVNPNDNVPTLNATLNHSVELVMGHYGDDVVGIIRFYQDAPRTVLEECTMPTATPTPNCSCQFLDDAGGVSFNRDAASLTFHFTCGEMNANDPKNPSKLVPTPHLAVLTRNGTDDLSWTLDGVPQKDHFHKAKSESELTPEKDKACVKCK